jgi:hypothetical protein
MVPIWNIWLDVKAPPCCHHMEKENTDNSTSENILIYKEIPTGKSFSWSALAVIPGNPNIGNVQFAPGWEFPVLSGIWTEIDEVRAGRLTRAITCIDESDTLFYE